jgi:integrase
MPSNWGASGQTRRRETIPSLREVEGQAVLMGDVYGDVVRLAAFTGLRRAELIGLRRESVDFETGTIMVSEMLTTSGGRLQHRDRSKTAAGERPVPILDQAREPLLRLMDRADGVGSPYVIAGPGGLHLSTATWSRQLRKARRAANGQAVYSLHFFRHVFISLLIATGEPVPVIVEVAGHANERTIRSTYRHALALDRRVLAARLSARITELTAEPEDLGA